MATITFNSEDFELCQSRYENGRLALVLLDALGLVYTKLSINLPRIRLGKKEVILKTYAENKGLYEVLLNSGAVIDTGRTVNFGYVKNAPIVEVKADLTDLDYENALNFHIEFGLNHKRKTSRQNVRERSYFRVPAPTEPIKVVTLKKARGIDDVTPINAKVSKVTAKAVLLEIDGDEHWIPKSAVVKGNFQQSGYLQPFLIKNWILKSKNLLAYKGGIFF